MSAPVLQKRLFVDSSLVTPNTSADHYPFFGAFIPIMRQCRRSLSLVLGHGRIETRYMHEQVMILADPHTHRPIFLIRHIIERVRVRHMNLEREQQWREDLDESASHDDTDAMNDLYKKVFEERAPDSKKAT